MLTLQGLEEYWLDWGHVGAFSKYSIWMVIWMVAIFKFHQTAHLRYVNFSVSSHTTVFKKLFAWMWMQIRYLGNWEEERVLMGNEGSLRATRRAGPWEGRTGGAELAGKGRAFQSQETAKAKGRGAGNSLLQTFHQVLFSCEYSQRQFKVPAGRIRF